MTDIPVGKRQGGKGEGRMEGCVVYEVEPKLNFLLGMSSENILRFDCRGGETRCPQSGGVRRERENSPEGKRKERSAEVRSPSCCSVQNEGPQLRPLRAGEVCVRFSVYRPQEDKHRTLNISPPGFCMSSSVDLGAIAGDCERSVSKCSSLKR